MPSSGSPCPRCGMCCGRWASLPVLETQRSRSAFKEHAIGIEPDLDRRALDRTGSTRASARHPAARPVAGGVPDAGDRQRDLRGGDPEQLIPEGRAAGRDRIPRRWRRRGRAAVSSSQGAVRRLISGRPKCGDPNARQVLFASSVSRGSNVSSSSVRGATGLNPLARGRSRPNPRSRQNQGIVVG